MRRVFIFLLILSIFSFAMEEKVERRIENGVEVIVNPEKPLKPLKIILKEELSIETEKFTNGELTTIGSFNSDSSNNIYIYDYKANRIVKFSPDGKIHGFIGKEGQGPGEFSSVSNICFDSSDNLIVTDRENRRFSIFSKDGSLIKEIKINFSFFDGLILGNGNFLFLEMSFDEISKKPSRVLNLYNQDFKKLKELDRIEMFNPLGAKIKGIRFNLPFSVSKDRIFTGNQERGYEIFVYDFIGNMVKKIKKEYKPLRTSEEYKSRFIKELGDFVYPRVKEKLYFPDFLPPFHYFLTDDKGRIYVMTYEREKPDEYIFDVFDQEGFLISRVSLKDFSLPEGLRGIIKNDYLYCVFEKESGFEKLVVYRISWK